MRHLWRSRPLPPLPPEVGDRAALLTQRAQVLPKLGKRSESILRAISALAGTVLTSFGLLGVAEGIQQRDQPEMAGATVIIALITIAISLWPLRDWRDGRRARQRYLDWLIAPDRWPGAPADVPLEAKTVADAVTLDELVLIRRRDAVTLQVATAENGPLLRLIFGSAVLAIGLIGMLGIFVRGAWPAAVFGGPLVILGLISIGGIFRLGGVTSLARHRVIVAAKTREVELTSSGSVASSADVGA